MRITSSDQLLARLDAGANLKLEGGVVKTQNSFSHAMRKIGDFFRSLTAGGREAIRTRSENLRAAMGELLRNGMNRNLVAEEHIGGTDYEVEMTIPLDQDVPPGGTPRFEIANVRHTPIQP